MKLIVGMDEVGRGCWAGPLVAGAVILKRPINGLKDSKQLSKKQRARLAAEIELQALAIGLGWVSPGEIDDKGLTAAVGLAMQRALAKITLEYDEIIIDGSLNFLSENPKAKTIIKADATVPCVSAASIVSKVARDNYMRDIIRQYPDYGFDRHVGYGTALHLARLKLYGVSKLHRRSFKPVQALIQ